VFLKKHETKSNQTNQPTKNLTVLFFELLQLSSHALCRAVDPNKCFTPIRITEISLVEICFNSLLPKRKLVVMCLLPTHLTFLSNFNFYANVIIDKVKPLLPVTENCTIYSLIHLKDLTHTFIHSYAVGTINGRLTPTQCSEVEGFTDAPVACRLVFTRSFRGPFVSSSLYINLSSFSIYHTPLDMISVAQSTTDVHLC